MSIETSFLGPCDSIECLTDLIESMNDSMKIGSDLMEISNGQLNWLY